MNTQENQKLINKHFHFKPLKKIEQVIKSFSVLEKIIFWTLITITSITAFVLFINVNKEFLIDTPARGGTLNEGVIGTPRFINPLLAVSSVDRDLTSLIYSGLLKKTASGEFITDIAESYKISDDKLEYNFKIKNNLKFHDGKPLTAEDVIFTILKAKDAETDSSKRAEWDGVTIEKNSEFEIVFRLRQPQINFLESATLGILPKHLWENIPAGGFGLSKFNTEPIGSGPYKLKNIKRDSTNIPINYTLSAFKDYSLGKPFIDKIVFHFAKNELELLKMIEDKKINSVSGIKPENASLFSNTKNINKIPLPRIFGLFFNQNESKALADTAVRNALDLSISKQNIVNQILFGFAQVTESSIPPHLQSNPNIFSTEKDLSEIEKESEEKISEAQKILERAGWKKNEDGIYVIEKNKEKIILSITVSTSNVPELLNIAEYIAQTWRKLGAEVSVKSFETQELNQAIIRPRNFEVLLFGMIINNYSDLYAFWHSSQRLDPGINITNYTNITIDRIVSELREATDLERIKVLIEQFNQELQKEKPAIFLYTPDFIYITPKNLSGIENKKIKSSEERFINVHKWFMKIDKVWKIFN
ncbi:MAG TPA: ABC transporter substrate-binding protein [Candidatus Paceibacterota bacterium]|nr:ABC transporter substrate-binding protein [Candidatus Paceibacterota bacterium]HMP19098.1 ABC transporter substrate-binding protein [Candidatus Paceibacterota bacterium]HMP85102.1 ABC transporter substrate-binding protein [Candidatus Paceibacterota bacterium]